MEINPKYPMSKLGDRVVTVKGLKKEISVTLKIKLHPREGGHKANCYYYEVLLLCWNKTKNPAAKRFIPAFLYCKENVSWSTSKQN